MKTIKSLAFTTVVVLALMFQLMNPLTVHADGETPPPTDATEAASTPAPVESPTDPVATESPVAPATPTEAPVIADTPAPATEAPTQAAETAAETEDPVAADTPVATDAPTESADATAVPSDTSSPSTVTTETPPEPTVLETVQQIPTQTDVVVLDQNGQPLPLATQDAANVVAGGDPVWCPASAAPGDPSCSASFGSLLDLVNGFIPTGDGTVWIQAGTDASGSPITIDGSGTWSTASPYALTLQGGVGGTTTTFYVPISIVNWDGDVTVNDITIINDAIATNGLTIDTYGNIRLKNVKSHGNPNNYGDGVYLDNTRGMGNVVVTGTNEFSNHHEWNAGMYINSYGDVILDGITATNNGDGIYISGANKVSISNSSLNNNSSNGVYIGSASGDVYLTNVTANQNYIGAQIYPNQDVYITDSTFREESWDGLEIFSDESPAANHIRLQNNQFTFNNRNYTDGYGAWLVMDGLDFADVIGNRFINNFAGLVSWYSSNVNVTPDNFFNLNCRDIWIEGLPIVFGNYCGEPLSPSTPESYVYNPPLFLNGKYRFQVDCTIQNPPPISLPNGDLVEIHCPVRGLVEIARLDSTTLPAPLPDGYTYASAFDVNIRNKDHVINVIDNGGYIKASFLANFLQPGHTYGILYWDDANKQWIPLKDYLTQGNAPRKFYLDPPEQIQTRREILSGVQLVTEYRSPRIEVSVNFPGTFVLVQH